MKYAYIRCSTRQQDETRQKEAMRGLGIPEENMFIEKASGKNFIDRDEWFKLLAKAVIGDTIIIKELDRLGRNNQEIKETFELLGKKGIKIKFLDCPMLDTEGKSEIEIKLIQPIILHLLGYMAEKEREKMLTRQKEAYESLPQDEKGRKVSRKKNVVVGRPNKQESLTASQTALIKAWINKDIKLSECIKETGLSEATLYRIKRGGI